MVANLSIREFHGLIFSLVSDKSLALFGHGYSRDLQTKGGGRFFSSLLS
jgi:hypothetical protein